jgi:hypothetical protein
MVLIKDLLNFEFSLRTKYQSFNKLIYHCFEKISYYFELNSQNNSSINFEKNKLKFNLLLLIWRFFWFIQTKSLLFIDKFQQKLQNEVINSKNINQKFSLIFEKKVK